MLDRVIIILEQHCMSLQHALLNKNGKLNFISINNLLLISKYNNVTNSTN